jgi:hypothetical protein
MIMKTLNKIWGISLLAILLSLAAPGKSMAQGGYISDQEFYDDLQPYGTWIDDPQYGNIWVPNADEGFRPYATRGHWVVTDYGNTWVSDYEWGWATFHYGRWRYDDYYGWEWIPGHQWAPAWVSWRHGGGYYGWAPLTPGISISISIGGGYRVPDDYWVCAPQEYITSPVIYNYYVPPTRSVTIIRNTTIINNTYVNNNVTYVTGPRVQEIRQVTHNDVRVYNINNASRPGPVNVTNNTVNIYRPAVQKAPDARPARVVDAVAYKNQHPNEPIASRNAGAPTFNRNNVAKLATVAHSPAPDTRVVRVNLVNNNRAAQPNNNPAATRPNQPNNAVQPQQQRQQQAQQAQQQRQQQLQQRQQQTQQQPTQQTRQQRQQRQQQAQQAQPQTQQPQQAQPQRQQQRQQQAQPQQRQQQLQQQRQQQAQQAQQQLQQQRQQQAQQAQQAQQQQRQQQAQQAQQQQRQQQAQQAQQQQRQQQAQQAQQQQRQQQAQQAQQQQRQQQMQQQRQQQAQQAQQQRQQQPRQQQKRPQDQPVQR